ncbi:MAG: hypothetical protein ACPGID_10590, partial [Rubricella sp.]
SVIDPPIPLDDLVDGLVLDTLGDGTSILYFNTGTAITGVANNTDDIRLSRAITREGTGESSFTLNFRNGGGQVDISDLGSIFGPTTTGVTVVVDQVGTDLTYARGGYWRVVDRAEPTDPEIMGGFATGVPFLGTAPTASYSGDMIGLYIGNVGGNDIESTISGAVSISFTPAAITGGITGITLDEVAGTPQINDLSIADAVTTSTGPYIFSGGIQTGAVQDADHSLEAGQNGALRIEFYGPNAEEVGGTFRISNPDGAADPNRAIVGGFVGD